jgi:BlaR1 peptidase M56
VRDVRALYALHLGVAAVAVTLIGGAATAVLLASDFSVPSAAEISKACTSWLSSGGPGAVIGLVITGLAAGVVFLAVRSAVGHIRAARAYVAGLPGGGTLTVDGTACRRLEVGDPVAFCAGYLRPQIYLSRGLVHRLSGEELRAVVAHERHHVRRRDPLRRLLARALADGLFFIPLLGRTSERYVSLSELAADQAAVGALGDRRQLAGALLKLSEYEPALASVAGIDPERVDHLLGDPTAGRWGLPKTIAGWSVLAMLTLASLLVVASLVQPSLDWPVVLAAGCMAAMVGAPLVLGGMALIVSQRALRAKRSQ